MSLDWVLIINQLFSSGMTACFTVVGGITLLTVGQLFLKFFVEPILEQAKLRGEIAFSLTYYANLYGNAKLFDEKDVYQAISTLRKQASQLRASAWTIPWYGFWQALGFVLKRKNAIDASACLIGLSNSMSSPDFKGIYNTQEEISKLLGFK